MLPFIETRKYMTTFGEQRIMLQLPIFAGLENKEKNYLTISEVGTISSIFSSTIYEDGYIFKIEKQRRLSLLKEKFQEIKKLKSVEWIDDDGKKYKTKISHVLPISRENFYNHNLRGF